MYTVQCTVCIRKVLEIVFFQKSITIDASQMLHRPLIFVLQFVVSHSFEMCFAEII